MDAAQRRLDKHKQRIGNRPIFERILIEIRDRAKPWRRGRWISSLRIAEWTHGTNENEDGRRKHHERAIKEKYTAGLRSLTSSTDSASTLFRKSIGGMKKLLSPWMIVLSLSAQSGASCSSRHSVSSPSFPEPLARAHDRPRPRPPQCGQTGNDTPKVRGSHDLLPHPAIEVHYQPHRHLEFRSWFYDQIHIVLAFDMDRFGGRSAVLIAVQTARRTSAHPARMSGRTERHVTERLSPTFDRLLPSKLRRAVREAPCGT
jgi:hypothetical protein